MVRTALLAVLVGVGCRHVTPENPPPPLPFAFEARPTTGEIRVVPALQLHAAPTVAMGSFLGPLPDAASSVRATRTRELAELSSALGLALPGEVNGALGATWPGQFRAIGWPSGSRQRVEDALRGVRGEVDPTLAEVARLVGGDGVLFSWMDRLEAAPLALTDLNGTVVNTPAGPVVVDDLDEPFLISARVGMALVTSDGEVVVRYGDTYETILSGRRGPEIAGRDLAQALAAEVAMVWATDPRLLDHEPAAARRPHRKGQRGAGRAQPEQLEGPAPVAFDE